MCLPCRHPWKCLTAADVGTGDPGPLANNTEMAGGPVLPATQGAVVAVLGGERDELALDLLGDDSFQTC